MAGSVEMQTYSARLNSFQIPHQLSKRRASSSSSKKKGGNTVEWPHESPSPEELARAGFFYRPVQESPDNVQCFLCAVKLDGWEPSDSPLHEHLSHASACAWAVSLSTARLDDSTEPAEARDPLSDEMVAARRGTFEVGDGWVHEGKRGWRCKVAKMVDAGWTFDRSPETEDGVTCFYCNLSLDGWEPKDDPAQEHRRRSPECPFFTLCEQYHGTAMPGANKGVRGKGRSSTASKTSRLSTQSTMSVAVSEAASTADLGESGMAVDDSFMSNATTASQATVKGGKRKPGRPKGTKGRKAAEKVEEPAAEEIEIHDSARGTIRHSQAPGAFPESSVLEPEPEPETVPEPAPRPTRNRQSRQVDSSVIEPSQADLAPKNSTRGRKAKAQPETESEAEQRLSEVSAQLQHELDNSMDYNDAPDHESTPQQLPPKPQRGVKRSSDGLRKEQESSVIMGLEFPTPPQPAAAKGKKGRKASKQIAPPQGEVVAHLDEAATREPSPSLGEPVADVEVSSEAAKPAKKATAKSKKASVKKGKGRKASSARSSKATVTESEAEPEADMNEDLARDEAEIEAELGRMAAEQAAVARAYVDQTDALVAEQEKVEEFEASPSHGKRHSNVLPEHTTSLPPHEGVKSVVAVLDDDLDLAAANLATNKPNATPSPSNSDKENHPSSVVNAPPTALKAAPLLSPTKTTRIPLAPSTPNRHPQIKSTTLLSPTKQLLTLHTTEPWLAVDLDTILLPSPQPTPGTLASRLVQAGGGLSSPEKKMSVEEWILWRAGQGEEDLRRKAEEMVGVFEREGVRALTVLGGVGSA
ncbi:hypothetical protein LTR78_006761 [Recurvomyces mirabilis]|uniref:BIR-domain-containing protein n=1 Tax=Recurvomyces mirabilis TaxID=574656 RepID=A0AAE0WK65_9PEZI|nr:hypothetical protein LTR78_006761 [Recurvomyces mirabilis]KAK5153250.1 hypothetical protein LTS14_007895 [Recurvomyces mirabilis]